MKKKIKSILKRVLKFAGITAALLFLIITGIYIYVVTRPDVPPFDDSDLVYHAPDVPDDENGYIPLLEAIGIRDDADIDRETIGSVDEVWDYVSEQHKNRPYRSARSIEEHEQLEKELERMRLQEAPRYRRNPTPEQIEKLHSEYDAVIEDIENVLSVYRLIVYPEECYTNMYSLSDYPVHCRNISIGSYEEIIRVLLVFSWYDFRHEEYLSGIEDLRLANRILDILGVAGGFAYLHYIANIRTVFDEFYYMIDSDLLLPEVLLQFEKDIIPTVPNEYLLNNLKFEYSEKKRELDKPAFRGELACLNAMADYPDFYCQQVLGRVSVQPIRTKLGFYEMYSGMTKEIESEKHDIAQYLSKEIPHVYQYDPEWFIFWASLADQLPLKERVLLWLSGNSFGEYYIWLFWRGHEIVLLNHWYLQCFSRMLKLKTAINRFYVAHGDLPQSLEILVPNFVDQLPNDPITSESLKYDYDKKIIYSVGKDLKDEGGRTKKYMNFDDNWRVNTAEPDWVMSVAVQ